MVKKKTDLIAYCDMYCGECPAYTQIIANLAGGDSAKWRIRKCVKKKNQTRIYTD